MQLTVQCAPWRPRKCTSVCVCLTIFQIALEDQLVRAVLIHYLTSLLQCEGMLRAQVPHSALRHLLTLHCLSRLKLLLFPSPSCGSTVCEPTSCHRPLLKSPPPVLNTDYHLLCLYNGALLVPTLLVTHHLGATWGILLHALPRTSMQIG